MSSEDFANQDILQRYGRELSADVAGVDRTYGRDAEVELLARTLAEGKSAVLLGPPGVGKSAIIQKLLHRLLDHARSGRLPALAEAKVYEISTAGLCSDTRYVGMQEAKIHALLAHAAANRLVYISDLWNIPGAGSYDTNPRGIYDLMRPGIEAKKLVLLGEMSAGRWEKLCREHPSLTRDFVAIPVVEPDEAHTRDILARAAGDLGLALDKAAIDRVWTLTRKFLPTQSFPGKGVELLRKVAQAARLKGPESADAGVIEDVFAADTGLPMHMISSRVPVTYEAMRDYLAERVIGQREAVAAVADALALYKTGLNNPDRPAGVLLFVGPTGVGKTELAKATAEFLFGGRERIFRLDLSEYKDFHSFEKLIGDPRQGRTGLLTDHVRAQPFTVILLDEFEKGHPNLADLFLQVFDDGRLTDATGETVGFQHALIILTSNVGSMQTAAPLGFGERSEDAPAHAARVRRALEAEYRPEFLNRIDRILTFHPLSPDDVRRIAQRELGKLYQREGLLERELLLEVDEGVIELLLERGFDQKYGARPLKRAIEEGLVVPLARALLSSEWRRFQLLRVARRGDGVELTFEDTPSSRKLENLERRTVVDAGGGRVLRVSLADVKRGIRDVERRIEALGSRAKVDDMRAELGALEQKGQEPRFWEEAFGDKGALVRRHRLAVEVGRYDNLRGRAAVVRELCEASFEEAEDGVAGELASEYARLSRELVRAEREIIRFGDGEQGDALLRIRAVGGKAGAEEWATRLAEMYAAWARQRGYDLEAKTIDGAHLLTVQGAYAYGYLAGEQGGHRILLPPRSKSGKRGDTFLVRVDVSPPGAGDAPGSDDEPPIRTYDLWRSRGVRDRRSGHVEGDARRVLEGRLDAFIEAYVDRA